MEVSWSVEVVDGASLVSVVIASDVPLARRVRVRNRLDGPVLPPRRRGVPSAGWDEEGVTVEVPPSSTVAVGYACTAPPVDPPVELVVVTGVDDGDLTGSVQDDDATGSAAHDDDATGSAAHDDDATGSAAHDDATGSAPDDATGSAPDDDAVARAIRTLGPARPPRDAVPLPELPDAATVDSAATEARPETDPDFDEIERRVAFAERLEGASVGEVAAVLDDLGGLAGVVGLRAQLAADATTLADSGRDPDDLRARLAAVDVPLESLRRLA